MSPDASIAEVLLAARTIAVVGMSRRPGQPSHDVPKALMELGFHIIPINPYADEILGQKAVAELSEVTEHVDIVDVFRRSNDTPPIARQAAAIGAGTLWLQLGIVSAESRDIAISAGLSYVEDRCLIVEARRHQISKALS